MLYIKDNYTQRKRQLYAMKELRKEMHENKITVSKADKGETTVIIDNDNRSFFCWLNDKQLSNARIALRHTPSLRRFNIRRRKREKDSL